MGLHVFQPERRARHNKNGWIDVGCHGSNRHLEQGLSARRVSEQHLSFVHDNWQTLDIFRIALSKSPNEAVSRRRGRTAGCVKTELASSHEHGLAEAQADVQAHTQPLGERRHHDQYHQARHT